MPLSKTNQCLFIHIPRTGGTSITKTLNFSSSRQTLNGVYRVRCHKFHFIKFQFQHLTTLQAFQIKKQQNCRQYFKFAFVRNPWDRTVSDYSNWYYQYFDSFEQYLLSLEKIVNFIHVNFTHNIRDAFYYKYAKLIYEEIGERFWVDPHFFPQYLFTHDSSGNQLLDYIGRFEEYNTAWKEIQNTLNITTNPQQLNSSKRKPNYKEYYNSQSKALIAYLYARDIEIFNYTF